MDFPVMTALPSSVGSVLRSADGLARTTNGRRRAVDRLVDALATLGVTHVFGVGGANIEDLYDALHCNTTVTGVVAKHEFSACTMADGYARATGRLGVVATTSGGGALNVVSALGEAYTSRIPVLALVGQPPTRLDGLGAFQDSSGRGGSLDAERVFGSVARFCARVNSPDELISLFREAASVALSSPHGPAVLLLPKDVQQAQTDVVLTELPRARAEAAPLEGELSIAVSVLESACRADGVLMIAGDGIARADARDHLARLVDKLEARVAVTPDAKDVFDNGDHRFIGVSGGMGHPNVVESLANSSACLLVGTRLPVVARDGLDELLASLPVVCLSPEQPHVEAAVVTGDLRASLPALVGRLNSVSGRVLDRKQRIRCLKPPPRSGGGLGYREVMAAIDESLPRDATVFVDAGNCGAAAIHHLPAPRRGRFVVTLGMGGMGYTFGAAIGASFADTDRPSRVYVIAGDGAFYMHGFELHTAVEHGLPITFVILNNNAHAMCVTREQTFYGGGYSYNRFGRTRLATGINAMFPSLDARNATTAEGLARALADTRATREPAFISVDCDVDEIPPVCSFLRR
jgi:acetolactate synthase I/II/III large subunit